MTASIKHNELDDLLANSLEQAIVPVSDPPNEAPFGNYIRIYSYCGYFVRIVSDRSDLMADVSTDKDTKQSWLPLEVAAHYTRKPRISLFKAPVPRVRAVDEISRILRTHGVAICDFLQSTSPEQLMQINASLDRSHRSKL